MTRVVTRTRCTKHTRRFRLPSAAGAEGLEPPAYGFGEGRPRMQLRTEAGFPPRFHPSDAVMFAEVGTKAGTKSVPNLGLRVTVRPWSTS
jgi:hypothetical protein